MKIATAMIQNILGYCVGLPSDGTDFSMCVQASSIHGEEVANGSFDHASVRRKKKDRGQANHHHWYG
jgi:hypothetical protein